jgi:large subunit ribosomal protein L6
MSRVGRKPIAVPPNVKVSLSDGVVVVEGPKGRLTQPMHDEVKMDIKDGQLILKRPSDSRRHRALHGLFRALIANMVTGVHTGFEKSLDIEGVGYRAEKVGRAVSFSLGYSHPIVLIPPEGIEVKLEGLNKLTVSGIDKQLVGQVAAKIRSFRPPEPYKGKGIRYTDEHIKRKAGKTAGA